MQGKLKEGKRKKSRVRDGEVSWCRGVAEGDKTDKH